MYITLASTLPTNIIVAYMPTSIHSSEEKDKAYDNLQSTFEKLNNKGPTHIVGDFNARLIYPGNSTEEEAMGKFTMYENNSILTSPNFKEGALENRGLLLQFTLSNELKIVNAMYQQHIGKLASYRIDVTQVNRKYERIRNTIISKRIKQDLYPFLFFFPNPLYDRYFWFAILSIVSFYYP